MVAPCYHLACSIFEDAGFQGRLRAVPEDEDGIDVDVLERKISAFEEEEKSKPNLLVSRATQASSLCELLTCCDEAI
jgi:DNA-binding transcriptional MocR family regulator